MLLNIGRLTYEDRGNITTFWHVWKVPFKIRIFFHFRQRWISTTSRPNRRNGCCENVEMIWNVKDSISDGTLVVHDYSVLVRSDTAIVRRHTHETTAFWKAYQRSVHVSKNVPIFILENRKVRLQKVRLDRGELQWNSHLSHTGNICQKVGQYTWAITR